MTDNQSVEELVKIFSDHFRPPTYVRESTVKGQGSIKTTFSVLEIEILYSELGSLGIVRVAGENLYSTSNFLLGQKFEDTCGLLKDWLERTTSELQLLLFRPQD